MGNYTNVRRRRTESSKSVRKFRKISFALLFVIGTVAVVTVVLKDLTRKNQSIQKKETLPEYPYGSLEELVKLDRFMKAYSDSKGGIRNLSDIKTVAVDSDFELDGRTINLRLYRKRPNLFRLTKDYGHFSVTTAFDGKEIWQRQYDKGRVDPGQVRILTGEEAQSWKKQSSFFDKIISTYYGNGRIIEPIKVVRHESEDVLSVNVEGLNGDISEILVNPKTMHQLLLRSTSSNGEVIENVVTEYMEVGVMRIPRSILNKVNGKPAGRSRIKTIELNIGILDSFFEQ